MVYYLRPLLGLFLLVSIPSFGINIDAKKILKLSNSESWKSLLYYYKGEFKIKDQAFYLSDLNKLNLKEELVKTLKLSDQIKTRCRFPARIYWLYNKIGKKFNFSECEDLLEFYQMAPLNSAHLMFASENVSIPSSMMGHVYLKISGKNKKKQTLDHAISYYTDVDNINFPKLIFESLVTGKKGFYTLSPENQVTDKYIRTEGRNVWDYKLNLNEYQLKLLNLHLYELKKIKLDYYFHTFNCATLIRYILNIPFSTLRSDMQKWVTPLDLVRWVNKSNLVESKVVNLSSRWKTKSLLMNRKFDNSFLRKLKMKSFSKLYDNETNLKKKLYRYFLSNAYNHFLLDEQHIDTEKFTVNRKEIDQLKTNNKNFFLDLGQYKKPSKTKSTAQVVLGYAQENNEKVYRFTVLPASHFIEDDSSEYLSESELQISRLTLAYDENEKKIDIDNYTLYSSSSYQVSDSLTGGISSYFEISYSRFINSEFSEKRYGSIKLGVGKTYRLIRDLDFYSLISSDFYFGSAYVPYLKSGLILREVFDMKTILNYEIRFDKFNKWSSYQFLDLKHIIDFDEFAFLLNYQKRESDNNYREDFILSLKKYF